MPIADLELATLSAEAYTAAPTWQRGDVHATATSSDATTIIAFRGTTRDPRDWLRDLDARPRWHRQLGFCHDGFLTGVEGVV